MLVACSNILLGASGNLQDKDLGSAGQLVDLAAKVLSSGGDGKIDNVHVSEDRADSLTVLITYSGLETADSVMSVSAIDSRFKSVDYVSEVKLTLSSTEGEVTAKLEMSSNAPEGAKESQKLLLIQVSENGSSKPYLVKALKCGKDWEKPVAPENMKITATAEPVPGGPTSKLPATKGSVLGPKYSPNIFKINPDLIKKVSTDAQPSSNVINDKIVPRQIEGAVLHGTATDQPAIKIIPAQPVKTTTMVTGRFDANLKPIIPMLDPASQAGLPSDAKEAKGPSATKPRIPLFQTVKTEDIPGLDASAWSDIGGEIYEDESNLGYYYYVPKQYHLDWSPEAGYALRFLYGQMDTDQTDNIKVYCFLSSGVDNYNLNVIQNLLKEYVGSKFKSLLPFPYSPPPAGISVSLASGLSSMFSIPTEKIVVEGLTGLRDEMKIAFPTSDINVQDFQTALTQAFGMSGQVTYSFKPAQSSNPVAATTNITISLKDPQSFQNRIFKRGEKFTNPSPYPVKLSYVHVLTIEDGVSDPQPIVYSYRLKDSKGNVGVIVPAGASATIDAKKMPAWLDATAYRMWYDYSFMPDDEADQKVIDIITGGASSFSQSQITFYTMGSSLSSVGAEFLLVTVKSKYFDPKGISEVTKTIKIDKDDSSFTVGPLYLVDQRTGEGETLFSYKIKVARPDDDPWKESAWKNESSLDVPIGPAKLKSIIGIE